MKSANEEDEASKKVKEVKKDANKEPIKEAQVPMKAKEPVSKKALSRESSKEVKKQKDVKIEIEPSESPQKNKETVKSPEVMKVGKPLKELLRECSVEDKNTKKETEEKPMKNEMKIEPAKLSIENELKKDGTSSEAIVPNAAIPNTIPTPKPTKETVNNLSMKKTSCEVNNGLSVSQVHETQDKTLSTLDEADRIFAQFKQHRKRLFKHNLIIEGTCNYFFWIDKIALVSNALISTCFKRCS